MPCPRRQGDALGRRWQMRRVGKTTAGRELDCRTWNELPSITGPTPADRKEPA
ncbi:hypothetical protein ACFYMO_31330 [Streptomyces sp. NPDC007025]|uniref:hypothetical protein n=1 Tax=Streptomyces sp. NPDC007025 TaxID=3364771 RepID=UPI003690D79D